MKGPDLLQANTGVLKTRMGAVFVGQRAVFRGHDLHAGLRDMDWMELYVFGITGRRFSAAQIELLHALWTYTSYPDARLWNNRVAALAGTARSTPALAASAALAVSEARIYGGHPCVRAIDFLLQARRKVAQGASVEEVVVQELKQRRIYGYGRPIEAPDERLPWLLALARDLGLDGGPHLALALEVERVLLSRDPSLRMNYASLTGALAADLGFSVAEFHHFQVPMLLAAMPPCFIEATQHPEGARFPLSCGHIRYEGKAKRSWGGADPPG